MNTKLNIALLCNNKMAFPAMQSLPGEGVLHGVATADTEGEVVNLFKQNAAAADIPYYKISRENYAGQLHDWLHGVKPDIVFVMTFPWRIPASILSIPKMGFLNFHYGLLPEMRGADPIFESIRQRKPIAGVTIHVMDEGLDTGPIVMREEVPLPQEYTYGMLSSQLSWLGDKMCRQLVKNLTAGSPIDSKLQDEANAKYWPRVTEAALWIRWEEATADEIIALARSCNPIAKGVPTMVNGWKIGICDLSAVNLEGDASAITPGTILASDPQNGLVVCCRDGKAVKLETVYTAEGVFPGYKLSFFGIAAGMIFRDWRDAG